MARTVTIEQVESTIEGIEYINRGTLTVAIATLRNGFQVVGTSGCADPAKYNQQLGEKLARAKVVDQVWLLEGYLLKEQMHRENAE
jgi:hypothetical protein